ncbi:hypothetical protein BV22DRAFT_1124276 [Leucogyrophana mollusca]|uniref:Uncharacterized protein n=1 Tax=Leucogyrophana mollusca TaxID=85980 RepID=A0ACB8C130_9AGAM|nr:hypothetical protein BV22DRAFT_1124276 [Leucogyrophana mollusca]
MSGDHREPPVKRWGPESESSSLSRNDDVHELMPLSAASFSTQEIPALHKVNSEDVESGSEKPLTYLRAKDRWKGRPKVGILMSILNVYCSSWLNILLLLTPLAWYAHFHTEWSKEVVFALCFLALIPHAKLFDFYGEQLSLYCGKELGDLITITLNNVVEATLAIILLFRCELKLLQSTITGVVLLHLLLVPGAAFATGGARIWEQDLHPARTQLNQTLLTVGVLALLLPAAFYAATSASPIASANATENIVDAGLTSKTSVDFLTMSKGMAILLLLIYIASRIFYHNPPGEGHNMLTHPDVPRGLQQEIEELDRTVPKVNAWVCLIFLAQNTVVMAVTAEWLVDSIDSVRENAHITMEFFGIVILPFVSFSADGTVSVVYFARRIARQLMNTTDPEPPTTLAKAGAIDLSIQFVLLWMPIVVLLGWIAGKPFSLLFDLFEVAALLGACFVVNYVTADSKTNWAEGFVLLSFYTMLVLCTWYYQGETAVAQLLACTGQANE